MKIFLKYQEVVVIVAGVVMIGGLIAFSAKAASQGEDDLRDEYLAVGMESYDRWSVKSDSAVLEELWQWQVYCEELIGLFQVDRLEMTMKEAGDLGHCGAISIIAHDRGLRSDT